MIISLSLLLFHNSLNRVLALVICVSKIIRKLGGSKVIRKLGGSLKGVGL